jgi:hypothetical protein
MIMFNKVSAALAAVAVIAAMALSPTSASAHHWGHGWGLGLGIGLGVGLATTAIVANTCVRRMVVATPFGPAVRWVNVC